MKHMLCPLVALVVVLLSACHRAAAQSSPTPPYNGLTLYIYRPFTWGSLPAAYIFNTTLYTTPYYGPMYYTVPFCTNYISRLETGISPGQLAVVESSVIGKPYDLDFTSSFTPAIIHRTRQDPVTDHVRLLNPAGTQVGWCAIEPPSAQAPNACWGTAVASSPVYVSMLFLTCNWY